MQVFTATAYKFEMNDSFMSFLRCLFLICPVYVDVNEHCTIEIFLHTFMCKKGICKTCYLSLKSGGAFLCRLSQLFVRGVYFVLSCFMHECIMKVFWFSLHLLNNTPTHSQDTFPTSVTLLSPPNSPLSLRFFQRD